MVLANLAKWIIVHHGRSVQKIHDRCSMPGRDFSESQIISVGIFDVTTNHLTRGCVQKWEDGYPEKL